ERGSKRLVAGEDRVETPLQRGRIQRAGESREKRNVVDRRLRLPLLEEPEPSLLERSGEYEGRRTIELTRNARDGRVRRRGALRSQSLDLAREIGHGRRLEERPHGDLDAQNRSH